MISQALSWIQIGLPNLAHRKITRISNSSLNRIKVSIIKFQRRSWATRVQARLKWCLLINIDLELWEVTYQLPNSRCSKTWLWRILATQSIKTVTYRAMSSNKWVQIIYTRSTITQKVNLKPSLNSTKAIFSHSIVMPLKYLVKTDRGKIITWRARNAQMSTRLSKCKTYKEVHKIKASTRKSIQASSRTVRWSCIK